MRSPRRSTVITFDAIAPGMQPTSTIPVLRTGSENASETAQPQSGMIVYWPTRPESGRSGAAMKARTCSGRTRVPTHSIVTANAGSSPGRIHSTLSGASSATAAPARMAIRISNAREGSGS
jgi:hypothetical protein